MAARDDWARAYARQAASDWTIYRQLAAAPEVPRCHALHFLQMAAEKVAKAYRFRDTKTAEEQLLTRHVAIEEFESVALG